MPRKVLVICAVVVLAACTSSGGGSPHHGSPEPGQTSGAARNPIQHVVFIVKENRTFDHYFGQYPGADGATIGTRHDGRTVPLRRAPDVEPIDLPHSFSEGLQMIDGGKMNGLDLLEPDLAGYDQHSRTSIPHYFAYAD